MCHLTITFGAALWSSVIWLNPSTLTLAAVACYLLFLPVQSPPPSYPRNRSFANPAQQARTMRQLPRPDACLLHSEAVPMVIECLNASPSLIQHRPTEDYRILLHLFVELLDPRPRAYLRGSLWGTNAKVNREFTGLHFCCCFELMTGVQNACYGRSFLVPAGHGNFNEPCSLAYLTSCSSRRNAWIVVAWQRDR